MTGDTVTLNCPSLAGANGAAPSSPTTLMDLPINARARVRGVRVDRHSEDGDLVRRLLEIGFIAGELVRVIAHGHPGREPVAVRIGGTTFALRRFEAERVLVEMVHPATAGA